MKGGIGRNLSILGVYRDPWEFFLLFLSRKINIKLCQICKKICIQNSRFKRIRKYTTDLKLTISHRSLRNLGLLVLLFKSFFIFNGCNWKYNKYVRIMWTELPPIAVQYHYRVTPAVSHDQNKVSGGQKKCQQQEQTLCW